MSLIKLECHHPVPAMYIASEYPDFTYMRGTAVLVYGMPQTSLTHVENMTKADRGKVTDDDRRVASEKFGVQFLSE